MLTAQQKRKENIGEYILYIYQVEDLIRAFQLNMSVIEKQLISQYQVDEKTRCEIVNWYKNLVIMMEKEGVREKGHLQFLTNQINELNEFHLKLMEVGIDREYVGVFQSISGLITELNMKSNSIKSDLQISLDSIYGFLLIDGCALFIVPYKFRHSVFFEEFLFLKFFSFDLFLRSEKALAVDLCKKHVEASVFLT